MVHQKLGGWSSPFNKKLSLLHLRPSIFRSMLFPEALMELLAKLSFEGFWDYVMCPLLQSNLHNFFTYEIKFIANLICPWLVKWRPCLRRCLSENSENGKRARNSVCLTLHLRNRTSYDCDFWCTCVKSWHIQQLFSFFKSLIFGVFRRIKWQKMT